MAPRKVTLVEALRDVEEQFELTTTDLNGILKRFLQQMELGLAKDGQDMAMIPSFGEEMFGRMCSQ